MSKNPLLEKVKPIELNAEHIEALVEEIEKKGKLSPEGLKAIPEVLIHTNILFKKIKTLGELLFLRADAIRSEEGFDEELDSIEAYLKGESVPDKDGKITNVESRGMTLKITMALVDLYLSSFGLSEEDIEDLTIKMRKAMKIEKI